MRCLRAAAGPATAHAVAAHAATTRSGDARERLHYMDPSIGPSDGTWALLGRLVDGSYTARQMEQTRTTQLDSDEPGEA